MAAFPALEVPFEDHVINNAGQIPPHLFTYMELTEFTEDLPHPDQPGHDIISQLGPNLADAFSAIRPGG